MNQFLLYLASGLITVLVGYFTNQLPNLPDKLETVGSFGSGGFDISGLDFADSTKPVWELVSQDGDSGEYAGGETQQHQS